MANVIIDKDTLEELMQGASEWANELSQHIAPASRDFGDDESAESQEQQAAGISMAVEAARHAITGQTS